MLIEKALTTGNPNSSVSSDVESHFFGSERIESFHPENREK